MKHRRTILLLAFVLLVLGLWWLLRALKAEPVAHVVAGPGTPTSPPAAAESPALQTEVELRQKAVAVVEKIFDASIAFYGRVVDQSGDPVPDAEVGYKAADKFNAPGTLYTGKSDASGYFQIAGIKGGGLLVGVGKEGYYPVEGKSSQNFGYGMGSDSTRKPPPTKDNPAIFVLHKMGRTEPLVYVGTKRYKPSKDGQPVDVNLATGKVVAPGQGDICFERWANDQAKNQRGHFDWRLRITVPGGGLAERNGQFDFEAPEGGYKESVEINMPASLGDQWSYTENKSYFVRLRDGRYARFDAMVQAGHESSALVIDAFLNPKPGSRNLEYDPKQAAGAQ